MNPTRRFRESPSSEPGILVLVGLLGCIPRKLDSRFRGNDEIDLHPVGFVFAQRFFCQLNLSCIFCCRDTNPWIGERIEESTSNFVVPSKAGTQSAGGSLVGCTTRSLPLSREWRSAFVARLLFPVGRFFCRSAL